MKLFKKILVTIALLFLYSIAIAESKQHYVDVKEYYTWIKINNSKCGQASFYVYVDRIYNEKSNLYYYNIYLWSDSYYDNCKPSNTYIENVNVYTFNNAIYSKVFFKPYILSKPKSNYFDGWNLLGYVYSYNSNQNIKITWGDISLY